MARRSVVAAMAGIVVVGVSLAGCGGSSSKQTAPTSPPPTAGPSTSSTSSALPGTTTTTGLDSNARRMVAFPPKIGSYTLSNTEGRPVTRATSDPKFTRGNPDAAVADQALYLEPGSTSGPIPIAVEAGQLKPGVDPGSWIQLYYTTIDRSLNLKGSSIENRTPEPGGSLGGQVQCWASLPYGSVPSIESCMWADTATFGILSWSPPGVSVSAGPLDRVLLTFRAAMEH